VIAWDPESDAADCSSGAWNVDLLPRIAPTARDEEGRADPGSNPDLDYLLRGTVQDTTARRMGGVAGHAGVFAMAQDVGVYAQSLLDRRAGRPSTYPLTTATVQLMTSPQQPGTENLRGFGWDIDTPQSTPRGSVFPIGSFGHTGFTGTSVWLDPASDTYVVLLTNSIHTRGSPPASKLRSDVATAAAHALGL
jgi:CubicO group peptidase (beta-lactamase class C family)